MIARAPSSAGRRLFIGALLGLGVLVAWPAQAWAGSYLDRAALLLSEATREADYLRRRLSDKELARTVHKLAEARAKAAATMEVPKEVADAHPHLLLTLETYERAADAAERGQGVKFLELVQRARDEENIFRGILKQNGWTLPDG
jgi:hypothetical protein